MSTPPAGGPPEDRDEQPGPGGPQDPGQGGWDAPPPPEPSQQWGGQTWGQPEQQPGAQPPQWGQAPAGGYAATPQTNGLAIGALVSSILGFFCWFPFIVGLILGYVARGQIRSSGGRQTGEGIALAAIVIGWIGVGLSILGIIFFVLVLGFTMPQGF